MIKTIQRVRNIGGRTHLFSFYPEKGSRLAHRVSCDVGAYRRVQLARYLIDYDHLAAKDIRFNSDGRIVDYDLDNSKLNEIIDTGSPFKTSGCPGKTQEGACNRPFGDGPPSDIRSFPFKPNKADLKKIRKQMDIPRLSKPKMLAMGGMKRLCPEVGAKDDESGIIPDLIRDQQESRGQVKPFGQLLTHYEALRAYIVLADLKGEDFTGGKITLYLGDCHLGI